MLLSGSALLRIRKLKDANEQHLPSLTEPPNSDPLSNASFHVKVKQSCGQRKRQQLHSHSLFLEIDRQRRLECPLNHLVFREGKLGLDGTQLIVIPEMRNTQTPSTFSEMCELK